MDIEDELDRIIALTDEELLAEVIAQGEDPEALAAQARAAIDRALGEWCLKRCDKGSPCALAGGHQPADRHETEHGCVFYD